MRLKSKFFIFLTMFLMGSIFFVGCSTAPPRGAGRDNFGGDDTKKSTQSGGRDNIGGVEESSGDRPEEKRVAVILGPGGYKTFAHAGVIKELRKQNIPIHKIVGFEWGALVAALYAQRGQINEAEWKLYKLEKLDLESRSFFSSKKDPQSLKTLQSYLEQNLDKKDVRDLAVPFSCPSLSLNQGTVAWFDQGNLNKAVESCLPYPPLFKPYKDAVAAVMGVQEAILRLKKEGYNVIVLVNVLGEGNLFDKAAIQDEYAVAILWNEARRQMWQGKGFVTDVVDVNTRGISIGDFESRKILTTAGEAAGEKLAKQMAAKYGF